MTNGNASRPASAAPAAACDTPPFKHLPRSVRGHTAAPMQANFKHCSSLDQRDLANGVLVAMQGWQASYSDLVTSRLQDTNDSGLGGLQADVVAEVSAAVFSILGTPVGAQQPLMEAGLDSLGAVELRNALGSRFGLELPPTVTLDHPSVAALAEFICAHSKQHAQEDTLSLSSWASSDGSEVCTFPPELTPDRGAPLMHSLLLSSKIASVALDHTCSGCHSWC